MAATTDRTLPTDKSCAPSDLAQRLESHPFFTRWENPDNGIPSYILTERFAPLQKALYFMEPSMGGDNEWLWFHGAFPPAKRWQLAAVRLDPNNPEIRTFPGMLMETGNPLVSKDGRWAYTSVTGSIYRQHIDGKWEEVLQPPGELLARRKLHLLVSDITVSSDGWMLFDSHIGNEFVIWMAKIQTGEWRVLHRLNRKFHHAAFSRHDPRLYFANTGPGSDFNTGQRINIEQRTWVGNRETGSFEPIAPDLHFGKAGQNCHEWWTEQGKIQWCDYNEGVYEVDPISGERQLVWNRPLIHGQTDVTGRWIIGDENAYNWNERRPCSVWGYDRFTGKEFSIARNIPQPPIEWKEWREWHPDPHPHFSADGSAAIYTTGACGDLNLAICPVEEFPT